MSFHLTYSIAIDYLAHLKPTPETWCLLNAKSQAEWQWTSKCSTSTEPILKKFSTFCLPAVVTSAYQNIFEGQNMTKKLSKKSNVKSVRWKCMLYGFYQEHGKLIRTRHLLSHPSHDRYVGSSWESLSASVCFKRSKVMLKFCGPKQCLQKLKVESMNLW